MKASRTEAAEARQRMVRAAADRFPRDGIGETGLAGFVPEAALTAGGFYCHFDVHDAIVCGSAMIGALTLSRLIDDSELSDKIREKTRNHLSLQRDARGEGR